VLRTVKPGKRSRGLGFDGIRAQAGLSKQAVVIEGKKSVLERDKRNQDPGTFPRQPASDWIHFAGDTARLL